MHAEHIGRQQAPTITMLLPEDCVSASITLGDFRLKFVEVPSAKCAVSYVSNTPIDYMRESLLRIKGIVRQQPNWKTKKGRIFTHLKSNR
jgi:hypothetical protein